MYIVDHLRDGKPPPVTAVLNPVLDGQVTNNRRASCGCAAGEALARRTEGSFELADGVPDEEEARV